MMQHFLVVAIEPHGLALGDIFTRFGSALHIKHHADVARLS
jgi:hypothetical protein